MMIAHGHFISRCKYCHDIIAQCRCPGPKATIYGVCPSCAGKIARGCVIPLTPARSDGDGITVTVCVSDAL